MFYPQPCECSCRAGVPVSALHLLEVLNLKITVKVNQYPLCTYIGNNNTVI